MYTCCTTLPATLALGVVSIYLICFFPLSVVSSLVRTGTGALRVTFVCIVLVAPFASEASAFSSLARAMLYIIFVSKPIVSYTLRINIARITRNLP